MGVEVQVAEDVAGLGERVVLYRAPVGAPLLGPVEPVGTVPAVERSPVRPLSSDGL